MMAALLAIDGGAERAADVADYMGVDAAAVTRLLDRLADAGLIGRCAFEGDRRSRRISLTERAQGLLPRLKQAAADLETALGAGLGQGERESLIQNLKALSARADQL
jgi:MarR family transcriptional regulator for hemolysin